MARARNIKPGFFTNDVLAECSALARILFQGLWCHADREGRLEDRPRKLKAEILPYDDCNTEELLCQLESRGFIIRYSHDAERFIQVVNFCKHQNPHVKEQESTIPAPCLHSANTEQAEKEPEQAGLIVDSLNLIPDSLSCAVVASKLAQCPHQEILSIFAEELPDLPQPRVWDGKRADAMLARWRWVLADLKKKGKPHDKAAGLEFFRRMFSYISKSDFLMGRKTDWTCSLPWIVEAENFAKIIEGNFEPKEAA